MQKLGVQGAIVKKIEKTTRDSGVEKVVKSSVRDEKQNLSQSFSFPSKGIAANGLRRNVNAFTHSQPNGKKGNLALVSNGSETSTTLLKNSGRNTSLRASLSDVRKERIFTERSTLSSGPGIRHSVVHLLIK